MADFNLGAEVSMDVDPIKASTRTLERELKNINKSLRSQRSEFKKNELSAEQLANREKDLGKAITAQEGLLKKRQDSLEDVRAEISKSNVVTEEQKRKLNSASRAVQQAENQLSTYNRELKETELAYKQFNRSSDQVKNSLGELKNRAKLSEIAFKQGTRSVDNYKDHLTEMNYTITKSKANINLLKQNLKEVSLAHGSTSRQADKLRNDILKESIAMQIAQGRADELSDELDKVARSQRKVALAGTLMTAGFTGARDSADRIATTLRSLGEVTQGVVGEIMATQFANLIPIMGSVVSAGAGIGGMLTSLAGGAIGLGGAFGIGMGAINAFAGQATYALKKLEDGELALTNETRRYQSVLSSLKNQWEGLIAQNQAKIFNTLSNGINIARTSLSNLNPFLIRTAGQIEGMSGKMLNWVKTSSNAKTAFNILNTQGTQAFGHLLQGAYHFVDGTTAVFNKLSPLFLWASQGFENMALSFRKWANSVEGSKAINGFVEYTKTNLPIVGRIFGNVFAGLFNLFSAFSGHSHNVLLGIESVTEGFRKWSEELKRSNGFKQFVEYLETNGPKVWQLIKNITGVLWGLVKGMAPVASATLSVTNVITGWMASMVNTHPVIGKMLGLTVSLTGALLLMLKPFFLIKGALSGMKGALLAVTGAQKVFGTTGAIATLKLNIFKNATMATRVALRVMKGEMALSTVMTRKYGLATKVAAVGAKGLQLAIKGVGLAFKFMTGPIGIVITVIGALTAAIIYLWKNNETFRNFVIKAWNAIKNSAVAVFGFLKPYIINIWNAIKNSTIAIWNALKNAAKVTWNAIKFAIQHPIQALKTIILAIWNAIKTNSLRTWNLIKTGIIVIAKTLVNGIRNIFKGLKAFFSVLWNFIKNTSLRTWNAIKTGVLKIIRSLVSGAKAIINTLKRFIVSAWNFIKNSSLKTWNLIKKGIINTIRGLSSGVKKIINALKTWIVKAWTYIKNKVISLVKGLSSGVKKVFNSLYKFSRSIFNKLKSFMSNVWKNIKNTTIRFAKALWSGVKSVWNALSRGTRSIFNKVKSFMSNVWRNIKNATVRYAKSLWTGVRNTFNSLYRGTRNIFNRVKGFMSNTWRSIKNTTVNMAKGLWNSVRRTFNNMNSGLKNIIGKIKGHITGMVNAVKKGLNKLIDGVNWVADKIGMDKLPKMKLHTGTESTHTQNYVTNGKLNRNTLATVGDKGKGNGPGGFRHEMIRYPNGKTAITPNRDTTTFLPKGSTVYNGAQTHAMLTGQPQFNMGTIPKFSIGSMWKNAKKKGSQILNGVGDKANGIKHKAMAAGDKALSTAKSIAKGTFKAIGDVFDYVSNPGKLVDKVLSAAGVDFSFVKGDILGGLMKAMYKKLKNGIKNLFDGWLEEGGGADLSSFDKYPITTPYSPNARVPGYPFGNGRHYGIDYGTPSGTTIKAPTSGTVSRKHDYGGGLVARLVNGKFTQWFLHLSDILKTGRVKQGEPFAKTGNSGHWTTGAHLHYQVEKGINDYITNRNTIDPKKFASMGGGGGVNKSAAAWKPDIRRAAKAIGVRVSSADVNDVARLIQTESSGNAGVTQQIQDQNSGGNEAQGLLQYTPGSFSSYAIRGHKNIKNGYDQLLAFFNNTDWRANLSYWKRRMASGLTGWGPTGSRKKYAKGTNSAYRGLSTVFEEGGEIMNLRGGEQIIPNDVSIAAIESVINSDIFNRTQSAVYEAISRFADGLREEKETKDDWFKELYIQQAKENSELKTQNSILMKVVDKLDQLLNVNNYVAQTNEGILNKEYFDSQKMSKAHNENMKKETMTKLMGGR
ncbi:peptidoglycan DD-metalloendopeptidase family protein [Staphylococcus borealis]|uniref:peptidoglycan DD-metalloendopeptidase family protein n=1 Tax=Staphylococcus borealis TaxID=2742203 RepID=UPI002DBD2FFE|nr:peptidoglycan DD-metalloendopeptidase family protein [Staphylococcus borealis]MEB7365443.1 peptidoglycan DD-metalloendopeptidase family protein [Staphylococcus borealis]